MDILAYTAEIKGNEVLFACSDRRTILTSNWSDAITYLLEPCYYAVVTHIDKFTDAFMSLLPSKAKAEIETTDKVRLDNGEKIFYSSGRQLSIGYGFRGNQRNEVNIYGLSRYSDKEITEVHELYELWREVVKAYEQFGITPTALPSPVGVYEPLLDKVSFARACDLPHSADGLLDKLSREDVAWQEWRATYKLGFWNENEVTDLDTNSAYPSFIAKLPDLSNARFYTSKTMPDKYSWGLLEGTLSITKDITPFLYVGKIPALITTGQLRQLKQYEWGDFEMSNGWFINIPKGYKLPFHDLMTQFYQVKQTTDNPMVKGIAKDIANGIGGKFNSRYGGKVGRNYQPIYAKMITSACKCHVADFIWSKGLQDKTISVTVDGVLVEGKPNIISGQGMGEWRIEPASPFLILSQLYQWGNSKHPDGHYINEILDMVKTNPKSSIYGDVDFNLLEYDRKFEKLPKTGGDLLNNHYHSVAPILT
ncbi:MAG: hypothetical protein PHQ86_07935 [Dehalococcoidales bacterium]|nr:hypothetical protein [Dehalococcoidales bacterium]